MKFNNDICLRIFFFKWCGALFINPSYFIQDIYFLVALSTKFFITKRNSNNFNEPAKLSQFFIMTVSQPVKQPLLVYAWIHFFIHLLKRRTEVFFQISPYVRQTRCQPIFCLTFIENFNFFWLLYIRSLEFERVCCLK